MRRYLGLLCAVFLPSMVAGILLLPGVAKDAVGIRDSDLFVTFAHTGATLQAPGFGLLHALSRVFVAVDLPISPAHQAHVLSSVFGIMTVALMALSLWLVYPLLFTSTLVIVSAKTDRFLLSLLGPLLLLTNPIFVRSSLYLERSSLSYLLITAWVLAIVWLYRESKPSRSVLLLGTVLGLGVAHQWWFLALLPVSLFLVFKTSSTVQSWLKLLFTLGATATLPFFYLYWINLNPVEYSWIFEPSIPGLRDWVLSSYWVDGVGVATNIDSILKSSNLEQSINFSWQALKLLTRSNWLLILGVVGLLPLLGSKILRSYGLAFVAVLGWLCLTLPWGKAVESQAIASDYVSVLSPLLILPLSVGLFVLLTRLSRAVSELHPSPFLPLVPPASIAVVVFLVAFLTSGSANLASTSVASALTIAVANEASEPGLMACFTYRSCYRELYAASTQIDYPHTLIPFYVKPDTVKFDTRPYQGFSYDYYPMIIFDILSWNRTEIPVYALDMFEEYFNIMGVDFGFINYIPLGYVSLLGDNLPEEYPQYDSSLSDRYQHQNIAWWDYWAEVQKLELAKLHMFNSSIYLKSNRRELAKIESNYSTNLAQELPYDDRRNIEVLRERVESLLASDFYQLGKESASSEEIIDEVIKIRDSGNVGRAIVVARGAVTRNPKDIEARLLWADLLASTAASDSAVEEYKHVLQLDPDNQSATSKLEAIEMNGQP